MKIEKLFAIIFCSCGLAMIFYAVYHAYHSPNGSSHTDELLVWLGAPLVISSAYYLVTGRGS